MKFLFYLVHPAKFQFHKIQIRELKARGHQVDIVINTKDILEDLLIEEDWKYKNIFPKSRKIKGVHVYIAATISIFLTVYRLWKFTRGKKYDLFIGDLLSIIGKIKGVPSLYPTDNDLASVPEQVIFFKTVNYIIAPIITDVGKYRHKKIEYKGYKALAHLHPNHYQPDITKLSSDLQNNEPFFIIRCTGFFATHDINKSGISDDVLYRLIDILKHHGRIFISSERRLPNELEMYRMNILKKHISHYMYFAKMFIGDSTTMCTEAAVLGTPTIEFDEYHYEIEQMIELEKKYNLISCFRTSEKEQLFNKIHELLELENLQEIYSDRRDRFLKDTMDVSSFLIWLFENYPKSLHEYLNNPNILDNF